MAAGWFSGPFRWLLGRYGSGAVQPPVADFTGTPLSGLSPLSVTFTDTSTNSPTTWLWEKNDGSGWTTFSTSQNPTESFTIGTWSVRLTASNTAGSDTRTRTGYITVTGNDPYTLVWVWANEPAVAWTWAEPDSVAWTWENR